MWIWEGRSCAVKQGARANSRVMGRACGDTGRAQGGWEVTGGRELAAPALRQGARDNSLETTRDGGGSWVLLGCAADAGCVRRWHESHVCESGARPPSGDAGEGGGGGRGGATKQTPYGLGMSGPACGIRRESGTGSSSTPPARLGESTDNVERAGVCANEEGVCALEWSVLCGFGVWPRAGA